MKDNAPRSEYGSAAQLNRRNFLKSAGALPFTAAAAGIGMSSSGYRGYIPLETLSTPGKEYDPFKVVPAYIEQIHQAIAQTA